MRTVTEIITHCAATPEGKHFTVEDIDRWHRARGWNGIGYHYVVYLDGSIHEGRPVEKIGAHVAGHNRNTIGVCYIGGVSANDPKIAKDTRTPEQKHALVQLLKRLLDEHPGVTLISGHHDYAAKACPSFPARAEYAYLTADRREKKKTEPAGLLQMGSRGWEVRALQGQLSDLGYHSGKIDGIFGRRTRDAVMSLQADAEIDVDGKVGPATRRAIRDATPVDNGARATETAKSLKGSNAVVKHGAAVQRLAGVTGLVAGGSKAVQETGLLDGAQDIVSQGQQVRGLIGTASDFIGWAWQHWWIIIPVIAVIVWWRSRKVVEEEVEGYRSGRVQ